MKRFLVLALVGALGLAGGAGLALGGNDGHQPRPKPPAAKAHPPAAPGKRPPSKSPPQAKKAPPQTQRPHAQASKATPRAQKGPAKPGKGSKPGAGSYSWDDYKRDLDKANQEQRDGMLEELPAELEIVGGAVSGIPKGKAGIAAGAGGAAIKNLPKLIDAKSKEVKGTWDELSATEKFIGARINDAQKAIQGPAKPKNGAQKANQGPAKP
jgi:hypothetical protein